MPHVLIGGTAGGEHFIVRVPYEACPPGHTLEIDWLGITNEDGSRPSGPVWNCINTSYGYSAIMAQIAKQEGRKS